MTEQNIKPTLVDCYQDLLDELKELDTAELVAYYSVPPTDRESARHKMKGYDALESALESIKLAKSLIK